MTPQNQPDPQNDELEEILRDVFSGLTKFEKEQCFPEARERLEAWGRKQRLDELDRLPGNVADLRVYLPKRETELQGGKNA